MPTIEELEEATYQLALARGATEEQARLAASCIQILICPTPEQQTEMFELQQRWQASRHN